MQILDPTDPFYRPRWRRVAIVAVTLGWAIFEFATGSPFWGILTGALGLYCLNALFIAYQPSPDANDTPSDEDIS